MTNANPSTTAGDAWESCNGEVGKLVHRLRWRRRSQRLRRAALLSVLAFVSIGGNYVYSDVATEFSVKATGSPCDHYAQELRAYYSDKSLGELDPAFWEHLSRCPDCQREFHFLGGISNCPVNHPAKHDHRVDAKALPGHISLDDLLKQATLAARG
jgi:hypothetical protein